MDLTEPNREWFFKDHLPSNHIIPMNSYDIANNSYDEIVITVYNFTW